MLWPVDPETHGARVVNPTGRRQLVLVTGVALAVLLIAAARHANPSHPLPATPVAVAALDGSGDFLVQAVGGLWVETWLLLALGLAAVRRSVTASPGTAVGREGARPRAPPSS
jgi:hypothetical protein